MSPTLEEVVDKLYLELNDAMENSTEQSERFITQDNVNRILNNEEVNKLYEALFKRKLPFRNRRPHRLPEKDELPRLVLGILVYGRRPKALDVFKRWLSSPRDIPNFPADKDLPLSPQHAELLFGNIEAHEILNHQSMFLPMIIRENQHQDLRLGHRKPYICREIIGRGSSGHVYKIKIPRGYWEYQESGEYQKYAAATQRRNTSEIILAVKRFRKTDSVDAESASRHFKHERDFLAGLKTEKAKHQHIIHDLGSITQLDGEGRIHDLFFPFADCNLRQLLTGEKLRGRFADPLTLDNKAEIFCNAVDVLGALSFLHHYNNQHHDIKPDNILVFAESKEKPLSWKIADFNFSHNQEPRPESLRDLSERFKTPPAPGLEAFKVRGIFQAPEVREASDLGSQFGQASDVWSMGCLVLMVLSYLDGREQAVATLSENLQLHTQNGARPMSFYVTPEMQEWSELKQKHSLQATGSAKPSYLPSTGTKEAKYLVNVNPNILEWMHTLSNNARKRDIAKNQRVEAKFFDWVIKYIRDHVVVVDPRMRETAKHLHESLVRMHKEFLKDIEQAGLPTPPSMHSSPAIHITDADSPSQISDQMKKETYSTTTSTPVDVKGKGKSKGDDDKGIPIIHSKANHPVDHTDICFAAQNKQSTTLEELLDNDSGSLHIIDKPCPKCNEYPLHIVLLNKDRKSLDVLLKHDLDSINSERSICHRKPIEIACQDGGDRTVLKALLDHPKTQFSEEIYKTVKSPDLKENVRKLLSERVKKWRKESAIRVDSLNSQASSSTEASVVDKSRGLIQGLGGRR